MESCENEAVVEYSVNFRMVEVFSCSHRADFSRQVYCASTDDSGGKPGVKISGMVCV